MTCNFTFEEETKKQSWTNQEGRYRKMNISGRRWRLQSVFCPTLGFKQNKNTSVRSELSARETSLRLVQMNNYCQLRISLCKIGLKTPTLMLLQSETAKVHLPKKHAIVNIYNNCTWSCLCRYQHTVTAWQIQIHK